MQVFQELDVLLMLDSGAQLHQLISKRVVNPPVCQEVHQVVIQGLKTNTIEMSQIQHNFDLLRYWWGYENTAKAPES